MSTSAQLQSKRISALTQIDRLQLTPSDLFVVADVSVPETKKITAGELQAFILGGGSITGSITSASFSEFAYTSSVALKLLGLVDSASYAKSASWADWAHNAFTASYVTASNVDGRVRLSFYAITASYAETCSYTYVITSAHATTSDTASYLLYIPGRDNGTAFRSITSSFSLRASTSSFLEYSPTRNNGTSSYSITASNSRTASFLQYSGFMNGSASYALDCAHAHTTDTASYIISTQTTVLGFNEDFPVTASVKASNSASIYVFINPSDAVAKKTMFEVWGDVIQPFTNYASGSVKLELKQGASTWELNTAAISCSVSGAGLLSHDFYLRGYETMIGSYVLSVYVNNGMYFDTSSRPIGVGTKTKSDNWILYV